MDILVISSDSEAYTETSDSEDQDGTESMFGEHAQGILSSLDETIGKIDEFLAFERGFLHGDIIADANDPSGQLGRVINVNMVVDLETRAGDIIKNVNSRRLSRVKSFVAGDYVIMGPWIGKVTRVVDAVTVLLNDGSKCEVLMKDADAVKAIPPILFEDAPYFCSPGQRVKVKLPSISKPTRWLCGSWRTSPDEGIVCNVKVGLVQVNWLVSMEKIWDVVSSPPPSMQEPRELTLFSCFPHANWQLGDWCTLSKDCSGNLAPTSLLNNCFKMQKVFNVHDPDSLQMYIVARTRSTIDILWQNGSVSFDQDPSTLVPVSNLGDHDFWPGQFVLEKVASEEESANQCRRTGVVKEVDAAEKTVTIKWLIPEDIPLEETVSAYELVEHPDFSYFIGEVVLRPAASVDKMDMEQSSRREGQRPQGLLNDILECSLLGKVTGGSLGESGNFLSCVGNVIGCKDEVVEVKWADGGVSKVEPSEIIGLERLLDALSGLVNDSSASPDLLANAVDREESHSGDRKNGLEDLMVRDNSNEDCAAPLHQPSGLLLPKAATIFLASVAANIFGAKVPTSSATDVEENKYQIVEAEEEPIVGDLSRELINQSIVNEEPAQSADDKPKFKQFDILNDCPDHHFLQQASTESVNRSWLKKIQREWNILEKNLPDTIFVRVFEERMDLLRACIVGVAGTPYHDGLFFFDIHFPPEYPQEPPSVHYISGGLRLNPNLYESGKVCLSLLKTWAGTGTEVWNPESSNLLQVLLSLQALVLNEKPYFNEAGYDKQVGRADGEKNSVTYNENAFLLSCKSMMYILRKPPKHFEQLVEEHFAVRGPQIVEACKAYLDGTPVGHARGDGLASSAGHGGCSTGFKITLVKLLPKLSSTLGVAFINSGRHSNLE